MGTAHYMHRFLGRVGITHHMPAHHEAISLKPAESLRIATVRSYVVGGAHPTELRFLLKEAGFRKIEFYRAGRIPALARSMIAVAHKP